MTLQQQQQVAAAPADPTEHSPVLHEIGGVTHHHHHHHHASVSQTVINMAKTCMGTGCLALPFAAQQGGILLHVVGLLGLGIWNVVMVQKLVSCHEMIHPRHATTMAGTGNHLTRNTVPLAGMYNPNDDDEEEEDEGYQGDVDDETTPLRLSAAVHVSSSSSSQSASSSETVYYDSCESLLVLLDSSQTTPVTSDHAHDNHIPIHVPNKRLPPKGMTTLVKLAWYALGPWGANVLDVIMVLYLIGVIVTYLNAIRSFLTDTPFTTGMGFIDSFVLVAIMGPLSVVPHTGHLAKASAMGLLVLLATFCVITWYGLVESHETDYTPSWHVLLTTGDGLVPVASINHNDNYSAPTTMLKGSLMSHALTTNSIWLPREGLAGVSQWFGICVFGFGIVPLAFSFREAMAEPYRLVSATWLAMLVVASCYIIVGIGLLIPYPNIDGDVLHELPSLGWVPMLTRIAMVLVVLVTAPLIIVPCGELLEGKIATFGHHFHHQHHHHHHDDDWAFHKTQWHIKAMVRWSICLVCAAISTFVPGFVNVLSFVGCCCVAVVGFCVPPFLHLILSVRYQHQLDDQALAISMVIDIILLLWGLLATVVSTMYTFRELSSAS